MNAQVKNRDRVRDLGEVYTNEREVNAMLDLVKDESYKISSRFLEPACGNGNFLIKILERKIETVKNTYKSKKEYEYNIVKALSSIYGIDICHDNIKESRERLFHKIKDHFSSVQNTEYPSDGFYKAIEYILEKNIFQGDSLNGQDKIVFSEFVNRKQDRKYYLTERLFSYQDIVDQVKNPRFEYKTKLYTELHKNKSEGM